MAATKNYLAYAGAAQITCTLTTLASGSAHESAVVNNTASPQCFDYDIAVTFTIASGSPTTSGPVVNVYAAASVDATLWPIIQKSSGAPYTTGAGDGAVGALGSPNGGLRMIGNFAFQSTTSASERTFRTEPMSVATAFGGKCPSAFSIIVENQTGVAFSSSTSTSTQYVQSNGVYTTSGN